MKSQLLQVAYAQFNEYSSWLKTQNCTDHEARAQLCRVNHFLVFLGTAFSGNETVFTDNFRRDDALREYKRYLRQDLRSPAHSINLTIEQIDKFFQFMGLAPTRLQPEVQTPTKPLVDHQLYLLQATLESKSRGREKAILNLLLHAGLSPEECCILNLNDVKLSTTGGSATLGSGGKKYEFTLDVKCRLAIREYLAERAVRYPFQDCPALFIDDRGNRLTASGVDVIVRQVGRDAGLEITARTVQQTFRYHEAKRGNKVLLAAELLSGAVQVS